MKVLFVTVMSACALMMFFVNGAMIENATAKGLGHRPVTTRAVGDVTVAPAIVARKSDGVVRCKEDSDCSKGACVEPLLGLSCGSLGDDVCICTKQAVPCGTEEQCGNDDFVCMTGFISADDDAGSCVSCDLYNDEAARPIFGQLVGDADNCACVDAKALEHLPAEELVFPSHRRAAVLCDSRGSCATPGHVITYNRQHMMMASYCSRFASCSARVTLVNSPRMRRRLRVPSRTDGLEYTPLAARFESRAEERVLAMLLRAGL